MNLKKYKVICFLTVFALTSCGDKYIPNNDPEFKVPTIIPVGDENYLTNPSDYIFNQDQLLTYELKIPGSALTKLDLDPAAEEYVEGMLIFQGDTISPIGIRYKGSVGAFVDCVSGDDWANPSGFKTCTKLSMKVKVNWEGREESFFGQKKLQFHAQNMDPSQLHERFGYYLFREMGVPAPKSVHARLMVNGKYRGLFTLTEQVDKEFISSNFQDDSGNLYKQVWPLNSFGETYEDEEYLDALKTNQKNNPTIDSFKSFGQQIAAAELEDARKLVEKHMDLNEIITYAAVDRTIKHDDGPFHWYCYHGGCGNHNYYWYEDPSNEKFHLIVWDLDNAFDNIIEDNNPITAIASSWGHSSNNCESFYWHYAYQLSANCDKLTAAWGSYKDLFQQKKQELINGPLSEESANKVLDKWTEQIKQATQEASDLNNDAISVGEWEDAILTLKEQLEHARNN